jgi:hypothetical protein
VPVESVPVVPVVPVESVPVVPVESVPVVPVVPVESVPVVPENDKSNVTNLSPIIKVNALPEGAGALPNNTWDKIEKKESKEPIVTIKPIEKENKYSIYIKNDYQNLKSNYFGNKLNEKLLQDYLALPNTFKSKLTYHQFEKLFIVILNADYFIELMDKVNLDRNYMIQFLNLQYDNYSLEIINKMPSYLYEFCNEEIQLTEDIEKYKL